MAPLVSAAQGEFRDNGADIPELGATIFGGDECNGKFPGWRSVESLGTTRPPDDSSPSGLGVGVEGTGL
jgi:hypothetical protein